MSGESDPKDSEVEKSGEARALSLDPEAPVFPTNPDSFKRPHTPPDDEPYLAQPMSRTFTPTSRPQTPLYRTEIKSISKLSDCVIPTIQPGTNLKEITVSFGSTYVRKSVTRHFKIENLKSSPFVLEAALDPLKGSGFSLEVEGVGLQATESRLISQAASPVSGEPKKYAIEVPSMTTIAIPIKWIPSKLGKVRLIVPFLSKGVIRGFRLILVGHVVTPPSLKARVSDKVLNLFCF
ncbi:hypothetical protein DSO57_1000441 [Entomophthora muscae]|uniref:Uncharacterized protein n=1 Tax=Entomophthora muscae TaxID=34485 RepID=A0ACC2UJ42_9FUNG|nr:hypothetical protein DSO57_1000441 [Entomophthora muscae]